MNPGDGSMRAMAGISLLVLMASGASAQTDTAVPSFEVASVKVSPPLPPGVRVLSLGGGPGSTDPGRVTYTGVTLRVLIARAYDVKEYQVEGPDWLDSERYDVIATIPKGADKSQVALMTQRLLAERFKLTLHHDSKPLAVYTLSVGKGGSKLKEVDPATLPPPPSGPPGSLPLPPPPPPPPGSGGQLSLPGGRGPMPAGAMGITIGPNSRHLRGNATVTRLCTMLSNLTDRPVIDLTDLKGTYEFDLSWTPDANEPLGGRLGTSMAAARAAAGLPPNAEAPDTASDPGMTLAEALQAQFGLKLEAKKNAAEILVVDHAEKVPTEN